MKFLEKYIEKIKPNYEKGGKYEKWLPVFESFETFLFVLGKTPPDKGCHLRDANDLKRTMSMVIIALIPALLFGMWNVGYQHSLALGTEVSLMTNFWFGFLKVLPLILVSYIAGLGTEFVFVFIKQKEIEEGFLVSGMLIPLIVPADVPLWMVAVATIFAVVFGKEVFGGTGMNIVNPALLTRAFLFFAYPAKMSGDKVWVAGLSKMTEVPDGFSGATPMGKASTLFDTYKDKLDIETFGSVGEKIEKALSLLHIDHSTWDMFIGKIPGSIGETSTLAILLGAVFLIYTGIGSWKIMLSTVLGGITMGLICNIFATDTNPFMHIPFYEHLLLGGFAFGAIFMATDPVTASQTEKGKWIYGFLIGVIAILVRVLNPAFPEGMMLAILLMNVFAPLIDFYIVKGHIKKRLKRAKVITTN